MAYSCLVYKYLIKIPRYILKYRHTYSLWGEFSRLIFFMGYLPGYCCSITENSLKQSAHTSNIQVCMHMHTI